MDKNRLIIKYKDYKTLQNIDAKINSIGFSLQTKKLILKEIPNSGYIEKPLYSKKQAIYQFIENNKLPLNKSFSIGSTFYSDDIFNTLDKYEQEKSKIFIIEAENNSELEKIYQILKNNDNFEYVEYDTVFEYPEINLEPVGTITDCNASSIEKINAKNCWEIATGKGVLISVLDTGVDSTNEDIQGQLWKDKFGNFGRHFYEEGNESYDTRDFLGHGTKISGIIGSGVNNGMGINGLASGSKIITVKLSGNNLYSGFRKSDLCKAFDYAIQQNTQIISISWVNKSNPEYHKSLTELINFAICKDIIVVCCTKNEEDSKIEDYFPANLPQVITVGVVRKNDKLWGSKGAGIDIFAVADGWTSLDNKSNNIITLSPASSWGPPQISSLIAMMLELNCNLKQDDIVRIIQENGQIINIGENGKSYPIKLIDVIKTLESVKNQQ